MAKIVQTQYRDNYGSHNWDGTGECPQHWKNKGGSTYVVHSKDQLTDDDLAEVINHSNDYDEEYIMHIEEYDPFNEVFEDWQTRIQITIAEDGSIVQSNTSGPEDLRRGLASYSHTWEYANAADRHSGNCTEYTVQYLFKNGMTADSEEEAHKIFEHLDSRAMA
tara:strand:+ start:217 stop:708 length:492 start_codon:yes stop_codon:yes gene_type:complete